MQTLLAAKSAYIFDWDGTIINTLPQKAKHFSRVMQGWLAQQGIACSIDEVEQEFYRLSGRPRPLLLSAMAQRWGVVLQSHEYERLSAEITRLNTQNLSQSLVYDDAMRLLRALCARRVKIFISSSVPQDELQALVSRAMPVEISDAFSAILGTTASIGKGAGHIQWLATTHGISLNAMLVLGDDEADVVLAREAGVDVVFVHRRGPIPKQAVWCVKSLDEVSKWIL